MIDPIGIKAGAVGERRLAPSETVAAVDGVARATSRENQPAAVAESSLQGLARELAATPPVDHERVQLIKEAIAQGKFPVLPAKIADRLIAAQLQWFGK